MKAHLTAFITCYTNKLRFILKSGLIVLCFIAPFKFIHAENSSVHGRAVLSKADSVKRLTIISKINFYLDQDVISDSAIMWTDSLRVFSKKTGIASDLAYCDVLTGKYFLRRADDARAFEYFYQGINLYTKINDMQGVGSVYLQLGVVLYLQQKYDDAISNLRQSATIYKNAGNDSSASTNYYIIGLCFLEKKEWLNAKFNIEEALKTKTKLFNKTGAYECYLALGKLSANQNEDAKAISYFSSCLNFFRASNNFQGQVLTMIPYSEICIKQNKLTEAKEMLFRSLQLVDSFSLTRIKIDLLKTLTNYYLAGNDYKAAFHAQSQRHHLIDSIFTKENSQTIEALHARRESDKKEAEIKILKQNERTAHIKQLFGLTVIIFLILLIYGLFRRFSFKQQAEQELNRSNLELTATIEHLKQTQQQLIHAEKMASLGRLSGGIAHELRNPLNFVSNFTKLSSESLRELAQASSQEEKQDLIDQIRNNLSLIYHHASRADKIISNMVNHSKKSSLEKTTENLNRLVEEFVLVAFQSYVALNPGFTCHIKFKLDKTTPVVKMNAHEIMSVLFNLVNNAFDSMYEKKLIMPAYEPELLVSTKCNHDKAFVSITDNGNGINEINLSKIFEPFFTTKPVEKGTGLGLSLSYDIIKVHQGDLSAKSNGDDHTEFTFYIPIINS